jgi:hypothetical protein
VSIKSDDDNFLVDLFEFDLAHERICQEYSPESLGGELVLAFIKGWIEYGIFQDDGEYTLLAEYELKKNRCKTSDEIFVELTRAITKVKNETNTKIH